MRVKTKTNLYSLLTHWYCLKTDTITYCLIFNKLHKYIIICNSSRFRRHLAWLRAERFCTKSLQQWHNRLDGSAALLWWAQAAWLGDVIFRSTSILNLWSDWSHNWQEWLGWGPNKLGLHAKITASLTSRVCPIILPARSQDPLRACDLNRRQNYVKN